MRRRAGAFELVLLAAVLCFRSVGCGGDAFSSEEVAESVCPAGERPPRGTVFSSPVSYSSKAPVLAGDCDLQTFWNAPGESGSLLLSFPSPLHVSAVTVAAGSDPGGVTAYAIYGSLAEGGEMVSIGTAVRSTSKTTAVLEPISVTGGAYTSLRIDVVAPSPSWAMIAEVGLVP